MYRNVNIHWFYLLFIDGATVVYREREVANTTIANDDQRDDEQLEIESKQKDLIENNSLQREKKIARILP